MDSPLIGQTIGVIKEISPNFKYHLIGRVKKITCSASSIDILTKYSRITIISNDLCKRNVDNLPRAIEILQRGSAIPGEFLGTGTKALCFIKERFHVSTPSVK